MTERENLNTMLDIFVSVMLLFVGIAILVVIHVCVVGRAFGGDYSSGGTSVIAQGTTRKPRMSEDEINNLPCFQYKMEESDGSVGHADDDNVIGECAVCLDNFDLGENCRVLPKCKHIFHAVCVDSWLLKTGACPICRTGVKSPKFIGQPSEIVIELA